MKIYVGPASRLQGKVRVPPSKNYTSRYIWVSALAEGESIIYDPATNDDAQRLARLLSAPGGESHVAREGCRSAVLGVTPIRRGFWIRETGD